MRMEWTKYLDHTLNVTLHENYGVVNSISKDSSPNFYEIVFKTGKLMSVYDDGLLIETIRENQVVRVYIPYSSIKCVDIF